MLKNVVMIGPAGGPVRVPLWRGRLAEVAGWHLGRFGD